MQAICDHVNDLLAFNYATARPTRTAFEAWNEREGVCRDFTHLAIAFCRAMNIPAKYCTGLISDIGQKPPYAPMDFAAWMRVWLGGRWHDFDPRNNRPMTGRVLFALGRDAADVPLRRLEMPPMRHLAGSDEQGFYWSAEGVLPAQAFRTAFGRVPRVGGILPGNAFLYDVSEPAFGAAFPVPAGAGVPTAAGFGTFVVVPY